MSTSINCSTKSGSTNVSIQAPQSACKDVQQRPGDEVCFTAEMDAAGSTCSHTIDVRMATAWTILLQSQTNEVNHLFYSRRGVKASESFDVPVDWALSVADLLQKVEAALDQIPWGRFPTATSAGEEDSTGQWHVQIGEGTGEASESLVLRCHSSSSKIHIASSLGMSRQSNAFCVRIQRQWRHILDVVSDPEKTDSLLVDLKVVSTQDLQQLWSWNARVPEGVSDDCIHHIFMRRARRHPEALAVCAHDGDWTYLELDELSTRLALALIHRNLQTRQIVVIYIEKSKWVPVAQLAVMKAGCASVVLDASLPLERQRVISALVNSRFVLTSRASSTSAAQLGELVSLTIDTETSKTWPAVRSGLLPAVSPEQACYIVFTSGSTGTPKGVTITHQNYASAIATQSSHLGFEEFDRVFDFTSYAFDVAWCNFMHTFANGGCLCIPSEEERKGDILVTLYKYEPNYVAITPSAAWFSAHELPSSVRTFHMGGEPVRSALVKELSPRAVVIHAYGPAECSTVSTAITTNAQDQSDPPIGRGLGCCTWVVKVDGSDLAPISEIGELWIEGPIVGQGYLNDEERTAAAFIKDPEWLLRGSGPDSHGASHPGRHGRLYRTGDLVRYRSGGELEFVGRKDSQVKVRGQRVELGEVEHHVRQALKACGAADDVQIIAEVFRLEADHPPVLVAFLAVPPSSASTTENDKVALSEAIRDIQDVLAKSVPPYMTPSDFLVVDEIPLTTTGKVDRRTLREAGPDLYRRQLHSQARPNHPPETANRVENTIRKVWSRVLNVPILDIGLDVHFTRLGGDSITAMQVVSRCREENLLVTVANILKLHTVRKIARVAQQYRPAQHISVTRGQEDYYDNEPWPLSPIQQMFFDDNSEGVDHYSLSFIVKLSKHIAVSDLLVGLLAVTTRHSMLRARFQKGSEPEHTWEQYTEPPGAASFGFENHQFTGAADMQMIVDRRQASLSLTRGPVFAVDVFNETGLEQTLLMSAHHIIMDLVSWRVVWHDLSCILSGQISLSPPGQLTFPLWCELQANEAKAAQLHDVMPFNVPDPDYIYWGTRPNELFNRDSAWHTSSVDEEATSLLLHASNQHLDTQIQDILVGVLIYTFHQTFTDRDAPVVFVETHGREPIADAENLDLSDTVGWFTSMFPVAVNDRMHDSSSRIDIIKFAKDVRSSMPRKGRPYFASRYLNSAGRSTFSAHKHPEIIFNYRGSFQQLESSDSLFKLEDRPERSAVIPAEGLEYRRPSLIDMNLAVTNGRLHIETRSHKHMRNHANVIRWLDVYADSLKHISHELAALSNRAYTLTDFPDLHISYKGLDCLTQEGFESHGIKAVDVVDMYGCTPMQEGILLGAATNRASYHSVCIWTARSQVDSEDISIPKFVKAWDAVASRHPTTSTIFLTSPDTGRPVQIVLRDANKAELRQASRDETAVENLAAMTRVQSHVSRPACSFTICVSATTREVACRLDMTHALMDAFSVAIIANDLEMAYLGEVLPVRTAFVDVVRHIEKEQEALIARTAYWKTYIDGARSCNVAGDLARTSGPGASDHLQYEWVEVDDAITSAISRISREMNVTRSTFLEVAWALVLYRLTGMKEVCFGYLSSGRDLSIDGIDSIVGPLINMLVARINLERPLQDVLSVVASFNIDHLDQQHMSLADLQHRVSVQRLFNTCITVGEAPPSLTSSASSIKLDKAMEQDPHEYDLVLAATLDKEETCVKVQYRTDFFSSAYVKTIQTTLASAIACLGAAMQTGEAETGHLCDKFFHHDTSCTEADAFGQWQSLMQEVDAGCSFPTLPFSSEMLALDASHSQAFEFTKWHGDISISTQVLAAWAILQASYGASKDVLVGWQASQDAMYKPLRIAMDTTQAVPQFLKLVQSAISRTESLPFLCSSRLIRLSGDIALAHDFQTVWSINQANTDDRNRWFANTPRALLLDLSVHDSTAFLSASFDSRIISHEQVGRFFRQFEAVLHRICGAESPTTSISQISTISEEDAREISSWNMKVPDAVHDLVHNTFRSIASSMPDAPAISAWDGELTYRELDRLSSRLAVKLLSVGVGPDVVVPLHFEKSMWEPVAVLGVMKAGGASVAIDVSQPVERARAILNQIGAPTMLVSSTLLEHARRFGDQEPIVVDRVSMEILPNEANHDFSRVVVQPSNLVYVCFTSGSTGQPKGAMITHSNFVSAIKYQQQAMGFRAGRRVFDFASYSFDVAWSNVLHTLTSGSCLCIPSEYQRKNDLAGAIRELKATFLDVTPSVIRTLDPREFPDLETAMLGGEPFTEADVAEWFAHKEMINTYGPAECSIRATITYSIRGIGVGFGMNTWVVTTDGSDRLSPVGAIGELWLEGPLVGRGYLKNRDITDKAFVTRSHWLHPQETARFYRTGDLVRYEADGSLMCVGRKDFQVKIRGQRTELGEVEHNIQTSFLAVGLEPQIMADVFKPRDADHVILIAFFKNTDKMKTQRCFTELEELLSSKIPAYMIPAVFVGLEAFPMTSNGKTDRKLLRARYADMTLEEMTAHDIRHGGSHNPPSTTNEKLLCDLWAETLGIHVDTISADSNFFRVGGDSLGAMRLVSAARKTGIVFSVVDVFHNPRLNTLAAVLNRQGIQQDLTAPFSLIDHLVSEEDTKAHVANLCGVLPEDVEDVLPCTPLQEGMIAESIRGTGDNMLIESRDLSKHVDVVRLLCAWEDVIRTHPILRTRFISIRDAGLMQVVLRHGKGAANKDLSKTQSILGVPLFVYEVLPTKMSWLIHHALYDGWSWPLIWRSLCQSYLGGSIQDPVPFQDFVKHVRAIDMVQAENFWKDQFMGFEAQVFPGLPSNDYAPMCDGELERVIENLTWDGAFTAATKIRLAWAILLSAATNSHDVLFGATVSGRQAPVLGIENISGPTFATIPLRVVLNPNATIEALLHQIQAQAADMIPFEQVGLQQIQRFSEDCKLGCRFQSQVVVQPAITAAFEDALFAEVGGDRSYESYPIGIGFEFALLPQGVHLRAKFDSAMVSLCSMDRMVERLEVILRQICSEESRSKNLSGLEKLGMKDLTQIWRWNAEPLQSCDKLVHDVFSRVALKQPDQPAICAWDGGFTYCQLDVLSDRLARKLVDPEHPQKSQHITPILFEKSKWTSVCQLAVMKAGGTAVILDSMLPFQRLETIIQITKPKIVLTSQTQRSIAQRLVTCDVNVIVVDDDLEVQSVNTYDSVHLPVVPSSTPAYVVFTSGTTGMPKGAIVSHSNFASALQYGLDALGFSKETRSYDLASYAFDVSWVNLLYTLCAGGCLCIPSQEEMRLDPRGPIDRMNINTAQLTPTVAKLLRGANLTTINFGGETLPRDEIDFWKDKAKLIHSYGPSECTPCAVSRVLDIAGGPLTIGKGVGACTWIVEPERGTELTAIGDVGELWIEGPLVGLGYLDDEVKTKAAFIEDPPWLTRGVPGYKGRQGRLYRTGDLVRYQEDGDIEFIGRKDAQVKIRGQRVELEEIEHHILNAIDSAAAQIVVDLVTPADANDRLLVAFIKLKDPRPKFIDKGEEGDYASELGSTIKDGLIGKVPAYMIPNGYIVVKDIHQTTSGKTDRGKMRKMASALPRSQLLHTNRRQRRAPRTERESQIQQIVAKALSLDLDDFGMSDNFIQLGGDSISAMKLVAKAQAEGLSFTVADLLTKKRLGDLADIIVPSRTAIRDMESATTTHDTNLRDTLSSLALIKSSRGHGILVDILPATHMQTEYLIDNTCTPRQSWFSSWVEFSRIEDKHRLLRSVQSLYEDCDVYRTTFFEADGQYYQAIFDSWTMIVGVIRDTESVANGAARIIADELSQPVDFGTPLARFTLVLGPDERARLVFSMSHAIYDAISLQETVQTLVRNYNNSKQPNQGWREYVEHISSHQEDSYAHWRHVLEGSTLTKVPTTHTQDGLPTILSQEITMPNLTPGITQASLFTLACAESLHQVTEDPDIVFGRLVSGRIGVPATLQHTIGPCINRVPVRVDFRHELNRAKRLVSVQRQYAESIAHETIGLSDIVQHCATWPADTRRFSCFVQYQNVSEYLELDIPGVVEGLRSRDAFDAHVAADHLEFFAVPTENNSRLVVRMIAGPGYDRTLVADLLRRTIDALCLS